MKMSIGRTVNKYIEIEEGFPKPKSFKLIKELPNSKLKIGKELDHFGGLVSGVDGINFTNKEYFKPTY